MVFVIQLHRERHRDVALDGGKIKVASYKYSAPNSAERIDVSRNLHRTYGFAGIENRLSSIDTFASIFS